MDLADVVRDHRPEDLVLGSHTVAMRRVFVRNFLTRYDARTRY